MNYRILIVEDEPKLCDILCDYYRSKGDLPTKAANGIEALEIAESQDFDAVLLDIMMPGLDGFSVCRALRKTSDVPIVFLTALSDEEDKLHGYELGADDYITKPFTMSVLYAKTVALIKRNQGNMLSGDRLNVGEISLEISSHKVIVRQNPIVLSPKEYDLLVCLMRNKNMVMSREQLLIKCWGYDYEGDTRAVDTYIKRLREKLGSASDCIKTVIKVGYKLEA